MLAGNGEEAVRYYRESLSLDLINSTTSLLKQFVTRIPQRRPSSVVDSVPELAEEVHAVHVAGPKRFDICLMDISMPV